MCLFLEERQLASRADCLLGTTVLWTTQLTFDYLIKPHIHFYLYQILLFPHTRTAVH